MNVRVFFSLEQATAPRRSPRVPKRTGGVVESQKPRSSSVDRTLLRTELLPMRHHVMSRGYFPFHAFTLRFAATHRSPQQMASRFQADEDARKKGRKLLSITQHIQGCTGMPQL